MSKRRSLKFVALAFIFALPNAVLAGVVTLYCQGSVETKNLASGQIKNENYATTVKFDEEDGYFTIGDSSKLTRWTRLPAAKITSSTIFWRVPVEEYVGIGDFAGSIDRATGEMTTNYYIVSEKIGMHSINGRFVCDRVQNNKF